METRMMENQVRQYANSPEPPRRRVSEAALPIHTTVPKGSLWARGLLLAEAEIATGEELGNRLAA